MKGVGWEADGCLDVAQAKKAVELASNVSQLCVKENMFYYWIYYWVFTLQLYFAAKIPSKGGPGEVHAGS